MMSPEADGRWLARGDVMDLRKNGFVAATYDLQPAGVIHSMSIELDLDPRSLVIEAMRVEQPFIAVEASPETSGECCRDPAPRLQALVGEGQFRADPLVVRAGGEAVGADGDGHQRLVHRVRAYSSRARCLVHGRGAWPVDW
jgi:hypothetical protein